MASHFSSDSLTSSLIYWAAGLGVLVLLLALVTYGDIFSVVKLP